MSVKTKRVKVSGPKWLAIFLLAFSSASPAHARVDDSPLERNRKWGAFVEPYLGLSTGSYTNDPLGILVVPTDTAGLLGPGLGLRAGAVYDYYFAALDVEARSLSNSLFTNSFKNFMMGITVGGTLGQFPLRFMVGLRFIDSLAMTGLRTLNADSVKVGVSYFIIPWLAVNIEIDARTYGQVNLNGTLVEPSYKSVLFSVSMPFTFFGIKSMPEFSQQRRRYSQGTEFSFK